MTRLQPIHAINAASCKARQADSKFRHAWTARIRRSGLSFAAKLLADTLAFDFTNHRDGLCNPSFGTLAELLDCSRDTIRRAVSELESDSWLFRKIGRGRGNKSEYLMLIPDDDTFGVSTSAEAKRRQSRNHFDKEKDCKPVEKKVAPVPRPYKPLEEPSRTISLREKTEPPDTLTPKAGRTVSKISKQADAGIPRHLAFWALKIAEGKYVPQTAITPRDAREMVRLGLVEEPQFRDLGITVGGQP